MTESQQRDYDELIERLHRRHQMLMESNKNEHTINLARSNKIKKARDKNKASRKARKQQRGR